MTSIKTVLDSVFLNALNRANPNDENFLHDLKQWYNVNDLCRLLNINRNRYNYLKRSNQIDSELLKLREVCKK